MRMFCCGCLIDLLFFAFDLSSFRPSFRPFDNPRTQHQQHPKVSTIANLFREICYQNKQNLMAGIIVAGWDKYHGGQVFSVPLGGSLHKQPFAIGG